MAIQLWSRLLIKTPDYKPITDFNPHRPFAVISDIHGNYIALQAVFADIYKRNIDQIVCLGDIVGYGPEPEQCLKAVRENCCLCVRGNHDHGLVEMPLGFNTIAYEAVQWTRGQVRPHWFSSVEKRQNWQFLQHTINGVAKKECWRFCHGSPRDPLMEYIEDDNLRTSASRNALRSKRLELLQKISPDTCFVGHTHIPGIIADNLQFYPPTQVQNQWLLWPGRPTLVNVGSVGQPRDGDNRACYVTVAEQNIIQFHRVIYDVRTVMNKILRVNELNEQLAHRLLYGI